MPKKTQLSRKRPSLGKSAGESPRTQGKSAHKKPSAGSRKATTANNRKPAPSATAGSAPPKTSKQSQLVALLRGSAGATLAQMTDATGWQPHTVRGVISGVLRKKLKLLIVSEKPAGGERTYRITGGDALPDAVQP